MTTTRRNPVRAAAVTAMCSLLVTIGACTGGAGPAPASSGTVAPPVTTESTPTSVVSVDGAPAALADLVTRLYEGGELDGQVVDHATGPLATRTPTSDSVAAAATVGTWKDEQVAVVTAGDDVTLAVGPTWRIVGGWWPSLEVPGPVLPSGPRWVLAVGSDARAGEDQERTRADTLQVVGVDGSGGGGVMGIARDLWVPLSTGGKGKINSALVFGGPSAQLATVRSATGLPIEGYAVVGFSGFITLVDELGGIPITVPEQVDATHARLVIPKGEQVMSGRQALAYARERKSLPDGDFGRSRHQGELLLAAGIKAKLAGPSGIPEAMTATSRHVSSDLTAEQALTFAATLLQVNPLQVGHGVAKGPSGWAGGQSIVVLGAEAKRLFADFKDGRLS